VVELVAAVVALIAFLSPHQEFHYNRPTFINSIAWSFGVTEVTVFLGLGSLATLLGGLYLYLSASPSRPIAPDISPPNVVVAGRGRLLKTIAALATSALVFFGLILGAKGYFVSAASGRVSGGVGEATSEGETPLGFHSALGTSSQPAAMVRLEGDYKDNPFAPMLYMRESALSELSGNEYLIASRRYDTDVPMTPPTAPYTINPDTSLKDRVPVAQSVYLLSNQKLSFSIDYPESIAMLQNPDPARFRSAFRAHSLALTTPISREGLRGVKVGDPRWDADTRAHYLNPHKDARYANMAYQISADAGAITDIEKAFAIADYLTEATTYTLTPNHEVKPGEDPVAPYLFGDLRGYCVHFAHAMVHMYRALGIPARIGTGYLTDLNQARDGHILLRMSDRHAWSEIYIESLGWVAFDIKPQKVESHGNTDVDMKLLEELMQKLDPGKEILPDKLTENERAFDAFRPRISGKAIVILLASLLTILGAIKFYLRRSWKFSTSAEISAERGYRALASLLEDYGERRRTGETREEFRQRICSKYSTDLLPFIQVGNALRYGGAAGRDFSIGDIEMIHSKVGVSRLKKLVALISPASITTFISGGSW
jgi:transglutaminase-like putative cysteine protease